MYKVASDKRQASLYRGRLSDWVNGEERLSLDDQLAQLRQGINIIEQRILSFPKGCEDRRVLGLEKLAIQTKIKSLKEAKPKSPPNWKLHFVNEARRILSDSQFQLVFNAAKYAAEREQSKIEQGTP